MARRSRGDAQDLRSTHTPDAIRRRLDDGPSSSYLRDFIYGAIDGAVTTFAVVSGVGGAGLDSRIVIVLGVANLVADGFSMAVSNFLGTRAEGQLRERTRRIEEQHVALHPEGEREEIRQIFAAKGFEGVDLERVVDVITSDVRRWVDTMLHEEHGLPLVGPSAWRAATATFVAFIVVGALPVLPFVATLVPGVSIQSPFLWSALMTGVAFFTVGAMKSRVVQESWLRAGAETLALGASAAGLAFLAGYLLRGLV
jgi:VIT1/CCC1 family predicted Fe2+/Mn2+ transporter